MVKVGEKVSKNIKGITIEIGGDTQPLNKALQDVNKQSRDLQSELRQVDRLLKLDPKNTDLIAQKQKLLADAVTNTKDKLDTLREAEKQVAEQFKQGKVGEEQYRAIQREVIATEQNLKNLEKQLGDTNNKWKDVADGLDKFGNKSKEIGKDMTKKVTAPIVGVGIAATKMGSDFVDSLAKVSTLADTTQVSMDDLKAGILDISNATGIASTEISGAVYDALSAGVETADVLDYIESNVMLVKAGFTDMGTAIDTTSTILNAYGDKAYDVSKIGDILVKTQDDGKVSVDELGKNLGRVIPTASSLGVNLDQLGASYAIMTAKGQNANIATTNLNSMLGELGKTGSKSDKALREVTGKSFKELTEEGKTVGDVLGILDQNAKDTGLSLSDMFGSTTAGSAALTLLSDGVEGFNESVNTMNNSAGTMAENFEKLKTPSEEMKISINKIKNVLIELGEIILPVLSTFAEWIGKVADKLSEMDEGTRTTIVIIAGLVAAIGPLLIFIGQMATGISGIIKLVGIITPLFSALAPVIAFLVSPIGLVVVAVGALIAIFVHLWKNNEEFRDNVTKLWNGLKDFFTTTLNGIKDFFKNTWNSIKSTGDAVWNSIKNSVTDIMNKIKNTFDFAWDAIKIAFDAFGKLFKGDFSGFLNGIFSAATTWVKGWAGIGKDIVMGIWEGISNMANWLGGKISGFFDGVLASAKKSLGIQSPSRVFADVIGKNMALGVGDGFTDNIKEVNRAVDKGLNSTVGVAETKNFNSNLSNSFVVNAVIREEQDIRKIAQELHRLQQQNSRGRGILA